MQRILVTVQRRLAAEEGITYALREIPRFSAISEYAKSSL